MSTTYLNVSNTNILPSVRLLGQMLQADHEESDRLRARIAVETKTASTKFNSILKTQQREFLDSMEKRRDELEAIYQPIIEHIPDERQRAIEEEVKAVSAQVPPTIIERRTKENRQIDGIRGSMEFFLDI